MRGFAFCDDLYSRLPLGEVASRLASLGYAGMELDARSLPGLDIPRFVDRCADLKIEIAGLHWLLSGGPELHLTHPSADVRRATLEHLRSLTHRCAELGGTVMVLGGGKKRSIMPGVTRDQALGYARDMLEALADDLVSLGVYLGLEPLEPSHCNLITTAQAAAELADRIGCPNIGITLDARAMETENLPREELIRAFAPYLVHIHVSDVTTKGPGMGATDLSPMLRAVAETGYGGWISVEAFDPTPDPDTVARLGLDYLRRSWPAPDPMGEKTPAPKHAVRGARHCET